MFTVSAILFTTVSKAHISKVSLQNCIVLIICEDEYPSNARAGLVRKSKEQEIQEIVKDLEQALLEDLKAKQKEIEISQEVKKARYNLLKVKQRLGSLEM